MKATFQKKIIKKKSAKTNRASEVTAFPLNKGSHLLILGTARSSNDINEILSIQKDWIIKFPNLKIENLLFVEDEKKKQELNKIGVELFSKKDLTWAAKPKSNELKNMLTRKYDVVVDFSTEKKHEISTVLTDMKYKFCIGQNIDEYEELYDFVFHDKNLTLNAFKLNIEKYLS